MKKLNEINFNELYKDELIKMLSNDNWILSLVIKSYNNDLLLAEQVFLDIEYISNNNR